MAYSIASNTIISDARAGSFANVTIQNNGFLEVNSSDGFQGTVAGYSSGGNPNLNVVDKFPFAIDTNASDVGDLTVGRERAAGQSSTTHGYSSGGGAPATNTIDKFPFSSDTNASDVGDLTVGRERAAGQSSTTHGYTSGGRNPPVLNTIDKFLFSVDSNATDVGDLTTVRQLSSGQSSTTHGYVSGGTTTSPAPAGITNIIDKFPFATDTNATDIGDLTQARESVTGQSSTTHGYASGGQIPPANPILQTNTIEKFPFATDTNATDIGDLTVARVALAGQSSTDSGYASGGSDSAPASSNVIDKFPFSADSNATDVGDLTFAKTRAAGQQD